MSKKIFIYSIPRPTATGLSEWTNDTSGKKLKKTKMGRCVDSIQALYSPKVGGLANYVSYTPHINPETGTPYLDDRGNEVMLQQYLEQKWNKPKDYFTNRAPSKHATRENDLTYFQTQSWTMHDGCTVLDLNNMDDEMGYYVFLASHLVANSEREWREHKWPRALWYIALENESETLKYKRNEIKVKAFGRLSSPDMTETYKRKIVSLLDLSSSRSDLTNEQVNNLLFDYIEKSGYNPGSNIDKFTEVTSLLDTPMGREQLEARWILRQALDYRIVYEKQDVYTWIRPAGTITIGDRYADAVDFILSPKKSAEVEELLAEIKAKKG